MKARTEEKIYGLDRLQKGYDMVPQSWIINCLTMYKVSNEIINFIEKNMKNWRVELTAGGKSLTETKIQRGIFQGDELSPLLFIIAMIPPTIHNCHDATKPHTQKMHSRIQT